MSDTQSRVHGTGTPKWKQIRVDAAAKLFILLLSLTMFCFATSFSQIHIHEKVDITKQTPGTLMKPGQPPAVVSGFVIPKGLRNRLQVYYGALERLDEEIPWYAKLKTIRSDTLGNDTTLYDMATEFRFPNLIANPETFTDWCGWWGEFHYKYYYTPSAATELYDVMRVVPRDTVVFGYITQIVGEGRTDTLGIFTADTVKLFADSTIVGWNVSFADYNNCLFTWNEKMDVFVALNCPKYDRLGQDSSRWADSLYDSYRRPRRHRITHQIDTVQATIGSSGCALSSMAMVLNAYGLDVDPGKLEDFMSARGFINRKTGAVTWAALDGYQNNSFVQHDSLVGRGLDTARVSLPLVRLDYSLQRCKPVIVQVANPAGSLHNHWVLVTDKIGPGQYRIVDPGPLRASTLASYGNTIYKMSIYKPKQ